MKIRITLRDQFHQAIKTVEVEPEELVPVMKQAFFLSVEVVEDKANG